MYQAHGPLVKLRFTLADLDGYELHDDSLPALAREALANNLFGLLADDAPFTADIHRGAGEGTHVHLVTPLAFVLEDWRSLLADAPHGPGGGRDLPFFAGHGVVIRNTVKDRKQVAAYVRCHPDARLRSPGSQLEDLDMYLAGFEDEARRKFGGLKLPKMGWDGGGVRTLYRLHPPT